MADQPEQTQPAATAIFDIDFQAETWRTDNRWNARGLGITVYADTEPAAIQSLQQTIQFLGRSVIKQTRAGAEHFKQYLDSHGIQYQCQELPQGGPQLQRDRYTMVIAKEISFKP